MNEFTKLGIVLCRLILLAIGFTYTVVTAIDPSSDHVRAIVGDVVNIQCRHRTIVPEADWVRVSLGQSSETELCLISVCLNGYATRFSVDKHNNYTLTIRNVTINDSGTYTCVVFDDFEQRSATILTITDHPIDTDIATTASPARSSTTVTTVWRQTATIIIATTATLIAVLLTFILVVFVIRSKARSRLRLRFGTDGLSSVAYTRGIDDRPTAPVPGGSQMPSNNDGQDEGYNSMKNVDDEWWNNEWLKGTDGPDEDKTSHSVIIARYAILGKSFLKMFRLNRSKNSSALEATTESCRTLASISKLWLDNLIGTRAAKRRIRRLLLYESSGYGKRAIRMESLQSATNNSPVMAVAILDGMTCIVHKDSNTIHIGSDQNRRIVVPAMKYPVDMVACNFIRGLYVADEYQRCIWRVVIDKFPVKWNDVNGLVPKSLSTRAGSLLITTNSSILKYSHDGNMLLKIALPMEPQHAVEAKKSTFIVSCKSISCNQLVEFDSKGEELRRFVCIAQLLRSPSYMILDRDEQLLVADYANNRILLLDTKLEHACTILDQPRDEIAAPQKISINEQTGHLLVVQWPSSSVGVYSVKTVSRCAQAVAAVV